MASASARPLSRMASTTSTSLVSGPTVANPRRIAAHIASGSSPARTWMSAVKIASESVLYNPLGR